MEVAQLLDKMPIGVAVIDFDGYYRSVNPAYCKLYGYQPEDMLGTLFTRVFAEEMRERVLTLHQNFLLNGGELKGEWDVVRHDGFRFQVLSESTKIYDAQYQLCRLVYVLDISERKAAERAMLDSKLRLESILGSAMDAVISLDQQHSIVLFNHAAETMFGYSSEEMLGQPLDRMIPPAFRAQHSRSMEDFAETGVSRRRMGSLGQLWALRADGTQFPIEASISHAQINEKKMFTVIIRDVTEQQKLKANLENTIRELSTAYKQLDELAHFDSLTHVPNRSLFSDRLKQALKQSRRRNQGLALVYIDLDGFKNVNDTHGHNIGDALLIGVAQRMQQVLREGDSLGRIGGDEFMALIVDLDQFEQCLPLVKRLLAAAAEPILASGFNLQISASLGIAFYPQDGETPEELINKADRAMYLAKRTGKNRYCCFSECNEIELPINPTPD